MRFNFLYTPKPLPEFHPAQSLGGFETPEKAESDRRALVSLLREGNPAQQKLAEIIPLANAERVAVLLPAGYADAFSAFALPVIWPKS